MKLIEVSQVKIAADRQRQEFNLDLLREFADSIQRGGLQHPIVLRIVGEDYVLVSGERRLRAVQDIYELGGSFSHDGETVRRGFIPYTNIGDLSPLEAEQAEWDENNQRADLTWQEKAQATLRLEDLRRRQAEASGAAPPTTRELGAEANRGISDPVYRRDVTRKQLLVAKHLNRPEVAAAKTVDDAFKALQRLESAEKSEALGKLIGREYSTKSHTVLNQDSLAWMKECSAGRFDVILTDPPYGMGADSFGDSDGRTAGAHGYEDSEENAGRIFQAFAGESFRIVKEQAHLYCFCDIDKFHGWAGMLAKQGWEVFRTPWIWYKRASSRAPWPQYGPQRKYETLIYAVKGKRPVLHMAGDVLEYPADANLGHSAQKPVALFEDLLKRSCRPGDSVLDPFMGSGTVLEAAHRLKLLATGIELDTASYGIALKRLEHINLSSTLGV